MNELDNIHKHLYEPELYSKEQLPEIYRNDIQYLIECLTAYKRIGLTPEEITEMNNFSQSQCAKLLAENDRLKSELSDNALAMTVMWGQKQQAELECATLKKTLKLACENQMEYDPSECPRDNPKCQECENTKDSIECRVCYYIHQAQEQDGME